MDSAKELIAGEDKGKNTGLELTDLHLGRLRLATKPDLNINVPIN
jgi:hypothetical protein